MDKSAAYVCHEFRCSLPIFEPQDLSKILQNTATQKNNATYSQTNVERLLKGKNWILIIFGFIGFGILLSFTPCVLPLIPIMVSIIVGQTIGVKKSKTFLLCLTYVLSMAFTYSIIGLLAGIFGVYLQLYMQSKWIVILFSLIFFTLALSMLGAFELKLPNFLRQRINTKSTTQEGGTYLGVMAMGVLGTLIISPCVTAPLAGVLSFIANTSNYILGAVSLFCLSIGMSMPLLIISLFSKNILPHAARWHHKIQIFFGLLLFGVAIWVASRVISEALNIALLSALCFLASIYMGVTKRKTKTLFAKFRKTLTFMVFAYGVALFWYALLLISDLGNIVDKDQKFFYGNQTTPVGPIFKNIHNNADLQLAINDAKKNHLPILLDFSAKWCASCVNMEKEVFDNPNVIPILNKFMLLRIDLTDVKSDEMGLAHQFNVVGPPIVLFYNNQGQLTNLRANGDLNVNQFMQILQQALSTINSAS